MLLCINICFPWGFSMPASLTGILSWNILFGRGRLSCALWDTSHHPWPLCTRYQRKGSPRFDNQVCLRMFPHVPREVNLTPDWEPLFCLNESKGIPPPKGCRCYHWDGSSSISTLRGVSGSSQPRVAVMGSLCNLRKNTPNNKNIIMQQ